LNVNQLLPHNLRQQLLHYLRRLPRSGSVCKEFGFHELYSESIVIPAQAGIQTIE